MASPPLLTIWRSACDIPDLHRGSHSFRAVPAPPRSPVSLAVPVPPGSRSLEFFEAPVPPLCQDARRGKNQLSELLEPGRRGGKGWTTSWCFERMQLWVRVGAGLAARPPRHPGTPWAWGLLPRSPFHLQTTQHSPHLPVPDSSGDGGFHTTGPGPDPSSPGGTGPRHLVPPSLVGPKHPPRGSSERAGSKGPH